MRQLPIHLLYGCETHIDDCINQADCVVLLLCLVYCLCTLDEQIMCA